MENTVACWWVARVVLQLGIVVYETLHKMEYAGIAHGPSRTTIGLIHECVVTK